MFWLVVSEDATPGSRDRTSPLGAPAPARALGFGRVVSGGADAPDQSKVRFGL